jgi:hypothetical protein
MRIEGFKHRRLGPVRVEDRKNVGDTHTPMAFEFVEAANGQSGKARG